MPWCRGTAASSHTRRQREKEKERACDWHAHSAHGHVRGGQAPPAHAGHVGVSAPVELHGAGYAPREQIAR
jgi:hypothetical protein